MAKLAGGVLVVVLLIIGFMWWSRGDDTSEGVVPTKEESTMSSPEKTEPTGSGAISSIMDAMKLGTAMKCSYSAKTGNEGYQSETIVKGDMFQSTTVMKEMTVYGLFDGETQYTWTSKDKQGMKMSKDCLNEMKEKVVAQSDEAPSSTVQDLREGFDAAMNVSCTPVVGGEAFVVPTDITFTDQCALMKQTEELMKQFQGQLPQGMTIPGMPSGQ